MAGIRRVLEALRRETPVLTRQAEDYPVLRSRAAGDTPVDPTGVPITALPRAASPEIDDVLAGVQSGTTSKFRLLDLLTWIKGQLSPSDIGAQSKILVSGILEGDGEGGISASDIMDYDTDTASGAVASFTADSIAPLKSLLVNIEPVQAGSGDPSPDNVRPISGWSAVNVWVKPTYDPTANPTATLQLGQTVYGGTLDVTNGVLTVDRAMVDMGTLDYFKSSGTSAIGGSIFSIAVSDVGAGMATRDRYASNTMISSIFATAPSSVWWVNELPDLSMSVNTNTLFIADNRYADAATFKAAMSGVQLVYELANPIIIPLTANQIYSLQGQNNVWDDTGGITIEYRNGENALLRDVAEAVENLQGKIQVNGLLKSNGNGKVFLAEPGMDYATPSQIPTVPSASTATPQVDGTASPGSTGKWADGGHVHPTDTTRAAAALEINGHPLTDDFDLTAADVGALASNGTAALSNAIAARHTISGEAGWYKFLSIPYVNGGSRDLWIMINTGGSASERSGILAIHMRSSLYGTDISYVNLDVAHMPKDWVRYENVTESGQRYLTLYIRKDSTAQGQMQFYVLYAVNHAGTVLGNLTWSSDGPSGNPPATATSATSNTFTDATRILYFQAQAVSAGSAQQLISITDADISEDHVLAGITFADPAYITGGGSWASAAGSFTLTGTATAATTADVLLVRKGN